MSPTAFDENIVVLTGASAGIGRELALQMASQGAWLALAARDAQRLEEVAEQCRQRGGRALVVPTDVTSQKACENLIARTVQEYGRIDTLVCNAGISMWARFDELEDLSAFDRMMQINYMGSVYCTQFALPFLKTSRGRIVSISSLAGRTGVPMRSGYVASKHAQTGFFESLRIELQDTGITVTQIYPGFVATEIRERAVGSDGQPQGRSSIQEDKAMTVEECCRGTLPSRRQNLPVEAPREILLAPCA